jgi:hypothetical protein
MGVVIKAMGRRVQQYKRSRDEFQHCPCFRFFMEYGPCDYFGTAPSLNHGQAYYHLILLIRMHVVRVKSAGRRLWNSNLPDENQDAAVAGRLSVVPFCY